MTSPMTARGVQLGDDWKRSPLGLYMPPRQKTRYDLPVAIDFFAGAGGFSCGLHQAGFHVAAAVEVWIPAAITYLVNLAQPGVQIHFDTDERERKFAIAAAKGMGLAVDKNGELLPGQGKKIKAAHGAGSGWISGYGQQHNPADYPNAFLAEMHEPPSHPYGCEHFFCWDIRDLTGEIILDALGLDVGDVALVVGGPPCQGYSMAGRRNVMDPRNSLVFEFARLICEIQPRTFAFENVPGIESMVTPEGIPVLDAFALTLDEGGYGEYDALRRSLAGRPGARAATRAKAKKSRRAAKAAKPKSPAAAVPDVDLLDLLGASS